jgi:N4-gp56 family major capsid protein
MSVNTTSSSGLADTTKVFYATMLLRAAEPALLHDLFGVKGRLLPGNGKIVEWRKFAALATKTGTITEGVTPNPDDLSLTKIQATIEQVGALVKHSDMLEMTAYDPIIAETMRLQGDQAGRTLDYRIREVLNAGTAVRYAGGQTERTAITASHILTMTDVKKAVRALERNDAKRFAEAGNRFVGLIHPSTKYDLTADTAWTTQVNATNNSPNMVDERFAGYYVGDAYGVRWYETTRAEVFAAGGSGGADVYSTVILGMGAYGVHTLQDIVPIVKPITSGGAENGLDLVGSIGWKAAFVSKILDDSFLVRIEHGVTA